MRIVITGGGGFLGSAIVRQVEQQRPLEQSVAAVTELAQSLVAELGETAGRARG